MAQLADLFVARGAAAAGSAAPLIREVSPAMADCAHDKHPELDGIVPPESFQAMMHAWATPARLHLASRPTATSTG